MQRSKDEAAGAEDALATELVSQGTAVATFAVFLGVLVYGMPPPWIMDINHPDFNPLLILMGFGLLGLVWQGFKLLRLILKRRSTGHSRMWLTSGGGVGQMGQALEGRIRFGRAPRQGVQGQCEVVLRCVEAHGFRDVGEGYGNSRSPSHFVVWESSLTVSPKILADGAMEVPFHFVLPSRVGTMQEEGSPKTPQRQPWFRFKGAIFLPGFRRVWSSEDSAIARSWKLEARLPDAGKHYRTEFVVPVQAD